MIQPSRRSCSTAAATTSATTSAGTTTAPSSSATTTSFGITATPPQPIGSCQPTKVRPVDRCRRRRALAPDRQPRREHAGEVAHDAVGDERGDAALHHARAEDVAEDAGVGWSPIASTTAIAPAGIASIAARVEIGDAHDAGVARSSRAGTKRSVKARPTRRSGCRVGERPRAAHPDVAQPLLQQDRGECRGRDAGERAPRRIVERLGWDAVHGPRIVQPGAASGAHRGAR